MTHRDDELGAELRELPTPEHAPGFFEGLHARLGEQRPHSPHVAHRALAAAAGLAAVAVAALLLGGPVFEIGGGDVASAAEVQAKVRASLEGHETLSGVLVTRCSVRGCPGKSGAQHWRFALSARGDLRLVGPTDDQVLTYDAASGVVRSAQRSASLGGGPLFHAESRGVAPGPPDAALPSSYLFAELGAFVRALLAAEDPRLREVTYAGRPAWRLDVDAVPSAIVPDFSGDRFAVVVDRDTGIPVRVVERKGDVVLRELRVEELAVDADLGPDAFRLAFPADAEVARIEDGFRRVPLEDVPAAVRYAPLVPSFVPDGFERTEVAVAESGPTVSAAANPPSYRVVSLSYRRGFDQLVVTTRLARVPGAFEARWSDPFPSDDGYREDPERVVLTRGALEGSTAEVLVTPRGVPHLWTEAEALVVTVAGSLSRDELVRVAESLERQG